MLWNFYSIPHIYLISCVGFLPSRWMFDLSRVILSLIQFACKSKHHWSRTACTRRGELMKSSFYTTSGKYVNHWKKNPPKWFNRKIIIFNPSGSMTSRSKRYGNTIRVVPNKKKRHTNSSRNLDHWIWCMSSTGRLHDLGVPGCLAV